jgi:catechol 2,3-dioxygenase-like lactoylglutathione lyase family enzyme
VAITGIESLIYGVENVDACTRFFRDFGLPLLKADASCGSFQLAEGSHVIIRRHDDPALPASSMVGFGVREVIWRVDTQESLEALVKGLGVPVRRDADGTAHFLSNVGLAMGLRVAPRLAVTNAPDPLNAPNNISRFNQHRKWRQRATPKVISHVVFAVADYEAGYQWMRERLNFRLSDSQRGVGKYLRADGSNNHHNLLLLNASAPFDGLDGKTRFHHANFGVEDIDEIMVGVNYMVRQGWEPSHMGLGRHRIDSALFYYLPCPAGGEAEYGADADYVDDSWVPRDWVSPLFGYAHFVHNLPPFLMKPPEWNVRFITDGVAPVDEGGH